MLTNDHGTTLSLRQIARDEQPPQEKTSGKTSSTTS
jgi:hypothetical protein